MTPKKRRFNHATSAAEVQTIGSMRKSITSFCGAAVFCLLAFPAVAGDAPLNFNYRVTGADELRPLLVFNDGVDTFIQPQDPGAKGVLVNGTAPVRQGPYFLVRGLVSEITITVGKKQSVRIVPSLPAHSAPVLARPVTQSNPPTMISAGTVAPVGPVPGTPEFRAGVIDKAKAERPAPVAPQGASGKECKPKQDVRETAFVASFKPGTVVLSPTAKVEIQKFIGETGTITSVEVTAEGGARAPAAKRADSIRKTLVAGGVPDDRISTSTREAVGIGSEIHIKRVTEIPCGASVVQVVSRRAKATIVWDRDAKDLADQIAKGVDTHLVVVGPARPLPIRVGVVEVPFEEAMQAVGKALGDSADLILRDTELVLKFKEMK